MANREDDLQQLPKRVKIIARIDSATRQQLHIRLRQDGKTLQRWIEEQIEEYLRRRAGHGHTP